MWCHWNGDQYFSALELDTNGYLAKDIPAKICFYLHRNESFFSYVIWLKMKFHKVVIWLSYYTCHKNFNDKKKMYHNHNAFYI